MHLAEPHPLDFDWRYTQRTCEELLRLAVDARHCLCVGAPSVARALETAGRPVVLVDRQPLQGIRRHLLADPSYDAPPAGDHDFVFVDPPWYPEVLMRWLGWAAAMAGRPARIFCSLWPESTRPGAAGEHVRILEWLSTWARVTVRPAALGYEPPPFEIAATLLDANQLAGKRWGDLLEVTPLRSVPVPLRLEASEHWHRFVFDAYQLALRLRMDDELPSIRPHPLARGWVWPSVSRRAPGRGSIDLWSSRNEVAIVDGGASIARLLDTVRDRASAHRLLAVESPLRPLAQWHLATLDFHRTCTWTHLA